MNIRPYYSKNNTCVVLEVYVSVRNALIKAGAVRVDISSFFAILMRILIKITHNTINAQKKCVHHI